MTNIAVTTVKVIDFKVVLPGIGYELYSGFALARVDNGELYSSDGVKPFLNLKRVCKSIEPEGLLPGGSFVKPQN
jgi:hypothetical protein